MLGQLQLSAVGGRPHSALSNWKILLLEERFEGDGLQMIQGMESHSAGLSKLAHPPTQECLRLLPGHRVRAFTMSPPIQRLEGQAPGGLSRGILHSGVTVDFRQDRLLSHSFVSDHADIWLAFPLRN